MRRAGIHEGADDHTVAGTLVAARSSASSTATPDTVLHVRVVTGGGGGPDKTILVSAAHVPSPAYKMAAAFMHPPNDPAYSVLERRARAYGCQVISIVDRGPLDVRVALQLLHWCRELEVCIWHGHDYKSNLLGLLLRAFHPMKLVTTMHGWFRTTPRTALYFRFDRRWLRYYDHVIAVSADLYARALAAGIPPQRCTLLPNAVDERVFRRRFPPEQSPLRHQNGVPRGRAVVGAVGRLATQKGFHELIRAVRELLRDGVDLELWIAGEGKERGALEKLVAQTELQNRVRLLGFVENTVELFQAFDVFALSSVDEGTPNALLEALSSGVAAVATAVGGVPAVITDGENGLLCAPNDVPALSRAIRRLVTEPGLRHTLAHAARRTIEERFTLAARIDREAAVYAQVLRPPAPSDR